ncbi:MAG: hypothetical protein ACI837_000531 [Crocinitomicaceae bacterium]|jgi:hypothetical protein
MNGKIIFAEIPRLTDDWWTKLPLNDPAIVWTVWNKSTYYLWGANAGNYQVMPMGTLLGGSGLAGVKHGPSRGRFHPHYVGIITMDLSSMPLNDAVFADLLTKLKSGKDIVVPIYNEDHATPATFKYSLGTGIGAGQPGWGGIQKSIFQQILTLGDSASSVDIPSGTYWPNGLATQPYPHIPLKSLSDIKTIISTYLT